ncbi:class II glutamine amidotransferase [Pyrococcus yayanosii]|uniref:Glutamine amidotransferase type-2 domain-containing protein n=1 Tax=Pyrococcus yayanosii (strain CH1 / JCM 16557) TaxID=529709 RepID=F8AGD9_PYRYC|nr:class II glutamine amidotransferase [Pyrococcus yayanosii]AEH25135.1 hypothetical protein PYCH_14650 [Pyrococcus yayanosii CH1]
MCRILIAVGEGFRMRPLVEATIKAAENDPYKAARGKGNQHKDGWGYVLLTKESLTHYRSTKPIFEDDKAYKLKDSLKGFSVLLLHARAASQGNKKLFNVQPFSYPSPHGYQLFFMHNGDLRKDLILEGLRLPKEEFKDVSDSFVAGLYLSLFLRDTEKDSILERMALLKPTVITSLNTGGVFVTPEGDVKVFGTAYMREEHWEEESEKNYMRVLEFYGADLFALVSSTAELYTFLPLDPAENGTLYYVIADFERESFTVEKLALELPESPEE